MCDVFSETTSTRCTVGPDQGGARSATCLQKPPLPGGPQGRIKVDHGVRDVSGNHTYPVLPRAGSRWTTECECRAPSSGTKFVEHNVFPIVPAFVPEHSRREQNMFPTMLCNTGGFVCFCGFGNIFFPEHSPRVPDFVPDNSPREQKMFPIAGAPQGVLDQGGPRSARCTRKPPFTYAP